MSEPNDLPNWQQPADTRPNPPRRYLPALIDENKRLKSINAELLEALEGMYSVRWHATRLQSYVNANDKAESAIKRSKESEE